MGIGELMNADTMELDLKAATKKDAIRELAKLLENDGRINNFDTYVEAVFKREEEFSTGIGNGIGIPHGKSSAVKRPSLAFGRSRGGVEFESTDGEPVYLVFMIAVPEDSNDEHLRILAQLSRKLMHEEIRQQLMDAESKEEILAIVDN